jgi:hypothetical protein
MSSQPSGDDLPQAIPAPPKKRHPCPHCGSEDIIHRLPLLAAAPGRHVFGTRACGLLYHTNQQALLGGEIAKVAPLLLNFCRRCGTVTRIYIDDPDSDWFYPEEGSALE